MVSIFAALATATIAASPAAGADDILHIATEGAYPPFNWREPDGALKGFDVDIANALCKKMDRKCDVVGQDWDGMIPALLAKKFDVIVASMAITDDRKKRVDFTNKYWQSVSRFAGKNGLTVDVTTNDLGGLNVGAQRGTIQACYITKHFPRANVSLYPSVQDGFSDLKAGRLDLYFAETIQMKKDLLDAPGGEGFSFVGPTPQDPECFGEGVGIAVRKGSEELREALNKAITEIRADGTYKKINAKYFDFDVYGPEAN
jgi:polar amino acid transport system substrate-binding protein/arginine/ornithine transport system substrate-binding protein